MCMGGGGAPAAPELPPEPPPPPTPVDPAVSRSRQRERSNAAIAQGRASTILTTPQGLLGEAETTKKTLLGK